jgi:hypothetical protein
MFEAYRNSHEILISSHRYRIVSLILTLVYAVTPFLSLLDNVKRVDVILVGKNNHDVNAGALSFAFWYCQKGWEPCPVHEIGKINGEKVFQNVENMFRIGENKFCD